MSAESKRLQELVDKLSRYGYRLTPQRKSVLCILADSKEHLKIEEIHARVQQEFPMTSLATIYNTVTMLKEIGEVLELSFGSGGNRYDGNKPSPHPHLLCERCGSVIDPDLPALEELAGQVSELTGYRITSHRLDFFGICPQCQKALFTAS
jgi:Fur family transcriptional regulator, peroxide stress response regulator